MLLLIKWFRENGLTGVDPQMETHTFVERLIDRNVLWCQVITEKWKFFTVLTGSLRRKIGGRSGVRERRSRADSQGQPGSYSVIRIDRFTKTPAAVWSRTQTTLGGIKGTFLLLISYGWSCWRWSTNGSRFMLLFSIKFTFSSEENQIISKIRTIL